VDSTVTDIANGVRALEVGVDALCRIAEFGGVQGDWAMDALQEVRSIMVPAPPKLCLAPYEGNVFAFDRALGEGRR
jgi:hypothetical protein